MPAHKSNVSNQKIAALAYAIAANHHPRKRALAACARAHTAPTPARTAPNKDEAPRQRRHLPARIQRKRT